MQDNCPGNLHIAVIKLTRMELFPELDGFLSTTGDSVDPQRIPVLSPLIDYIVLELSSGRIPALNFICTHNSRRSQLAQAWATAAGYYYKVRVNCFSGGTEVTEFNIRAVQTLRDQGFGIRSRGEQNPFYTIACGPGLNPLKAFSKLYDDPENPKEGFAAVMTCSDAEVNCPFVPGASARISLHYEDPKAFDGTPLEKQKYAERSIQIGTEMNYVFREVAMRS